MNLYHLVEGEVYQLGLVDGKDRRYEATTFNPDECGYNLVWFRAPEVLSRYSLVRIITRDPVAATEQMGGATLLNGPMETCSKNGPIATDSNSCLKGKTAPVCGRPFSLR